MPSSSAAGVTQIRFSPDGRRLAVAVADGTIGCWDTATGAQRWSRAVDSEGFRGMGFVSDGRLLVAAEIDNRIVLRDAESSAEVRTSPPLGRPTQRPSMAYFSPMTLSPDGRYLAAAHDVSTTPVDPRVRVVLWDLATGQVHWSPEVGAAVGPASAPEVFSPDGSRIAISRGRRGHAWDVATGREVLNFKGEASVVSFSGDGRTLAAVSRDGRIRVWDTREATPERRAPRARRGASSDGSPPGVGPAPSCSRGSRATRACPSRSAGPRSSSPGTVPSRPRHAPPVSPAPGPSNLVPSFK